jgi:hypothetical protein
MIASPSDVPAYRLQARQVLHDWNDVHSQETNAVLMPVGWETHSSPELGKPAQHLINERLLSGCDLLVGVFWNRLGTQTLDAPSGTVDEIRRHVDSGKPAMIYFVDEPAAPSQIDFAQRALLADFREWCQAKGLVWQVESVDDFKYKFGKQLQISLQKNQYLNGLVASLRTVGGVGVPTLKQGLPNPRAVVANELSPEARELLCEAARDSHGKIFSVARFGGRAFRTNGAMFPVSDEPRVRAKFRSAFDVLVNYGLVSDVGNKGEVFSVTSEGCETADWLEKNGADS